MNKKGLNLVFLAEETPSSGSRSAGVYSCKGNVSPVGSDTNVLAHMYNAQLCKLQAMVQS